VTDPCDRAEQEIEYELAEALRQRKPPGPPAQAARPAGDRRLPVLQRTDRQRAALV
jgi:hypothetical protein